jgi:hypothetical protein
MTDVYGVYMHLHSVCTVNVRTVTACTHKVVLTLVSNSCALFDSSHAATALVTTNILQLYSKSSTHFTLITYIHKSYTYMLHTYVYNTYTHIYVTV